MSNINKMFGNKSNYEISKKLALIYLDHNFDKSKYNTPDKLAKAYQNIQKRINNDLSF